jgi:D-serine deaminase-like pyridoxal phosphate-dependent protein
MQMRLEELNTPCAALDLGRLTNNLHRMRDIAHQHGLRLRPHLKTAKSEEVARLATADEFGGITVSTVREVQYFASRGFGDITYAVCAVPAKVSALADLCREHPALHVSLLVDNPAVIAAVDEAAGDGVFDVLIEIDSGEHRSGLEPGDGDLLRVAQAVARASHLRLAGVLTHGGHSYEASSRAELVAIAEQERLAVVDAAQHLCQGGFTVGTVSLGSTPTCLNAESFAGVTEIRPGVYMFHDLVQAGLGCCTTDDIALSVVATVISHQRSRSRLIIDAGALALSKDLGVRGYVQGIGYGLVADLDSGQPVGDLHVSRVDQEHGYIDGDIDFESLPVGAKVRVLPNHACLTAAPYSQFFVHEGAEIRHRWDRISAW